MGTAALSVATWTRRMALALAVVPLGFAPGLAVAADGKILVVSRKRLLNDTDHARALLEAEIEMTAELQRQVDAIMEGLNAEEQELTRLRPTLDRAEFEERVAAFDHRIRSQRRHAQRQAATLQNVFRVERLKLVEALGPLLDAVRIAHDASIVLNADQAMSSDQALDVTDEVIARFNAEVPLPTMPDIDTLDPGPTETGPDGEPSQQ
jgi:Skp family chaperone for outer membrane proteins